MTLDSTSDCNICWLSNPHSHRRLNRGEMSHSVAKVTHSRHSVKREGCSNAPSEKKMFLENYIIKVYKLISLVPPNYSMNLKLAWPLYITNILCVIHGTIQTRTKNDLSLSIPPTYKGFFSSQNKVPCRPPERGGAKTLYSSNIRPEKTQQSETSSLGQRGVHTVLATPPRLCQLGRCYQTV